MIEIEDKRNGDNVANGPGETFEPPRPVGVPFEASPETQRSFPSAADFDASIPLDAVSLPPPGLSDQTFVPRPLDAPAGSAHEPLGVGAPGQPMFSSSRQAKLPVGKARRDARNALICGVGSIFIFGVILGPIAMAMGLKAVKRDERRLGWWAFGTGLFGLIAAVALLILVAADVIDTNDLIGGRR